MARVNLGRDPSGRVLVVDATTRDKLKWAEKQLKRKLTIVQGSYMGKGGASASANTHKGGGVIDIRTWDLASVCPRQAVEVLRRAGFVAWYRTKAQGFDPHIHAIDYGNPNLDPSAQRQVDAWAKGLNGLASGGKDDGPRIPVPKDVPSDTLGPLSRIGIDRWLSVEVALSYATGAKRAALKATSAAMRAALTVSQLRAAETWKTQQKAAAEKAGHKSEAEGRNRELALINSLIIKKKG